MIKHHVRSRYRSTVCYHATAIAIKEFDREELEEAFVEMLYNKAIERQTFINIMKDHGIDAEITLTFLNANQVP